MIKYEMIYIGNLSKVAEYIYMSDKFALKAIICEENRKNDQLTTFSLVRGVKICYIKNKKELIKTMLNFKQNSIFLMCSFGLRVPCEKLEDVKIFNIHYGELPKYKGRHATYWATVENEKQLGITLHKVSKDIDQGEIVSLVKSSYYFWENENSIFHKLTENVKILITDLYNFLEGKINCKENVGGKYYPIVKEEDKTLNIDTMSYTRIFNIIRAQSKYNGGLIVLGERKFQLKSCRFSERIDGDSKYYIENESLYIKIKNNIYLVSEDYEELYEKR